MSGKIEIGRLVFEGGFPDENSLLSFCLSVGVLHDRRAFDIDLPYDIKVEDLSSYELCSLILHDQSGDEKDLQVVTNTLDEHLKGGILLVRKTIKGRSGIDALISLIKLIPP